MLSKALSNYPQFRFRDGQKRLWNPIAKKVYANLPEERVRLALVDYLTFEAGTSSSRVSFESPVSLPGDKSRSRTDIICYTKDFKPLLLVECKAPDIKLDEKAAIQIARYNQKVEAPFLLVTNGMLDFWFEIKDDVVTPSPKIPSPFTPKTEISRSLEYWEKRGFIGEKLSPAGRSFAKYSCSHLFTNPVLPVKYLSFDGLNPEFALGHYYRVFSVTETEKVALSLAANPYGGTRLNGVLNQNAANTAFFSASLDLIADSVDVNTEIHSGSGMVEVDLSKENGFSFSKDIMNMVDPFYAMMIKHS